MNNVKSLSALFCHQYLYSSMSYQCILAIHFQYFICYHSKALKNTYNVYKLVGLLMASHDKSFCDPDTLLQTGSVRTCRGQGLYIKVSSLL